MTEQIIINGIDVSGCVYIDTKLDDKYYSCQLVEGGTICSGDCYYKQLQRKTVECEELKEATKELKECLTQEDKLFKTNHETWFQRCCELNNKLQIATEALEKIRLEEIETFDMTESEYETEVHDTEFSKTLTWCEEALERIKE